MSYDILPFVDPPTNIKAVVLDALVGTGDSGWGEIQSRDKGSIFFAISDTATIQVRGSNKFDPADSNFILDDSDDGELLATVTEADPIFTWSRPFKWLKLIVTANTGTVSAWLQGV